jgi:hypothetical protein
MLYVKITSGISPIAAGHTTRNPRRVPHAATQASDDEPVAGPLLYEPQHPALRIDNDDEYEVDEILVQKPARGGIVEVEKRVIHSHIHDVKHLTRYFKCCAASLETKCTS